MPHRVLIGGIWHETNSFSPLGTDLSAFRRFLYLEGEELLRVLNGTNTEIGGMVDAAPAANLELLPATWAGAVPSGMVARSVLDQVVDQICSAALRHAPLDGVLLALHGAMMAEGIDEADAYVVRRVREVVGTACPIVATIDMHANVTAALVEAADVLIGYDTLPHVDMAERGREAAHVLSSIMAGAERPAKAFRKLPLLSVPQMQGTQDQPMQSVMALRASIEREPDILTCSVVVGFPYCDVPHLGAAVLAYGRRQEAERAADRIASLLWSRKEEFRPALIAPAEAVRRAVADNRGPIFLVEPADNVGGGAPGDGTSLLQALIDGKAEGAACVMWDPEAAAIAARAGVGGRFCGQIGGRTLELHGKPVTLEGEVTFADRVSYKRDAAWMHGQPVDLGLVATIRAGGIKVIVTSERAMPFDTLHLRIPGIDPERAKIVTVKSGINWIGIFGEMAAGCHYVDTPGVCTSNLERLPYTRIQGKVFPLASDAIWAPPAARSQ